MKSSIRNWLETQLSSKVLQIEPVSGGCINQAYCVRLASGQTVFVKINETCAMFDAEASGLTAINQTVSNFAPDVLHYCDEALVLEWLTPASSDESFWQSLADQLALMHQYKGHSFGFDCDNYCGATPQPNPEYSCGIEFFAEQRLLYQAKLALNAGLLSGKNLMAIERIAGQLHRWLPKQPPVLLHGDLWSGNVMATTAGAKLIDPACYFGMAEADMAMTLLFGGFSASFYDRYAEQSDIASDWQDRAELYNLYHLLNHLNLFGGQYQSAVQRVIGRYGF
ncbi:fructosamine kinase family protein [Pleionea mediterranea]|uniref:Fructosamine-3-kinase n=1 Tax=Pleionea mediterranea TaxID=523701 RepID=A0A316FYV1_9GAMM|nr:fructosamine kinase family protein [Pleionea mediterranea]PWK47307.1 fructosamine-3-kinase [Pleionea mediterranea]